MPRQNKTRKRPRTPEQRAGPAPCGTGPRTRREAARQDTTTQGTEDFMTWHRGHPGSGQGVRSALARGRGPGYRGGSAQEPGDPSAADRVPPWATSAAAGEGDGERVASEYAVPSAPLAVVLARPAIKADMQRHVDGLLATVLAGLPELPRGFGDRGLGDLRSGSGGLLL